MQYNEIQNFNFFSNFHSFGTKLKIWEKQKYPKIIHEDTKHPKKSFDVTHMIVALGALFVSTIYTVLR